MDFVYLAEASQSLIRQLLSSDDGLHQNQATAPSHSTEPVHTPMRFTTDDMVMDQKPLLSPSAEAELFLLASNFLLYVALVIITIMIAKIYFPSCLERRGGDGPTPARSYSYRKVEQAELPKSDSYYASDYSDDNDDDEDYDDMGDYLDEDEEDDEEEETDGENPAQRQTQAMSFLEFDQETLPRAEVLKRLVLCIVMLNVTFVTWGALQERILTRKYPRVTGEYFRYSYALVFTNRFWTLIMSTGLLVYLRPKRSRSTVIYEYSFPSISNMLSSWCQYEALRYVSFPAVTLSKSFKLAPVMAMGKILGNKSYPQYDYIVALVIGTGITLFMTSTDDLQFEFGHDAYGEVSATWTGIMLLFFFLFFDSFTSQWQSRMFQRHRDLSMIELMFATSAFSTVLSFVTLVHTKELYPAFSFVYRHSEIHLHFFLFSICSTIGQLFIFYTIKNFGAVVFTLIMTTRILLSIAVSCVLYGHQVSAVGFLGLMMVLGAVLYRIKRKAEGQQLLKWQGIEDEKAHDLVSEWHEHIDM